MRNALDSARSISALLCAIDDKIQFVQSNDNSVAIIRKNYDSAVPFYSVSRIIDVQKKSHNPQSRQEIQ